MSTSIDSLLKAGPEPLKKYGTNKTYSSASSRRKTFHSLPSKSLQERKPSNVFSDKEDYNSQPLIIVSSDSENEITDMLEETKTSSVRPMCAYERRKRRRTDSSPISTVSKKVQTRLALFDLETTCKECGMSYMPTNSTDSKLHSKFHNKSLEGRDWMPGWGLQVNVPPSVKLLKDCIIVKITSSSRPYAKRATQEMSDIVNTELSAPPENPTWKNGPSGAGAAYLYIDQKKKKSIGMLIVERVKQARTMLVETAEVIDCKFDNQPPPIMGVSRIFTARNYRRKGIGSALLTVACSDFIYGLDIEKCQVAWSQPSSSGAKLALYWYSFQTENSLQCILTYYESDSQIKLP